MAELPERITLVGRINNYNSKTGFGTVSSTESEFFFSSHEIEFLSAIQLAEGVDVEFEVEGDRVIRIAATKSTDNPNEEHEGIIITRPDEAYGFVLDELKRKYFVHRSAFTPGIKRMPSVGTKIFFKTISDPRGARAIDVRLLESGIQNSALHNSRDFLTAAGVRRLDKDTKGARDIYERGLTEAPSPELIVAYATMEKSLRDLPRALTILERGIGLYPDSANLFSDAGQLALRLSRPSAIQYFEKAYALPKIKMGQKGLLANQLATAHFHKTDYASAYRFYLEAKKHGYSVLQNPDYYISWVHSKIPFAKSALNFFSNCKIRVDHILIEQDTYAVDFICDISHEAFDRSYGLHGRIFVRCLLLQEPQPADVRRAIEAMKLTSQRFNLVQDSMILIVKNLSELKGYLVELADTPNQRPYCVTLDAEDLQASKNAALPALRTRLDQWLYRRDLYNEKFPVTGNSFFGRSSVLKEMEGQINSGNHVGIFGLRKTGKTSLLYSIRDRLIQDLVVYLDLQQFGTDISVTSLCDAITKEFNVQLEKKYPGERPAPKSQSIHAMLSHFLGIRGRIRSRGIAARCVLLVDEVERLSPMDGEECKTGFEFFSALRGLAQQERGLISIVCGADPVLVEKGKWGKWDNPVFQFYQLIYMPPLDRAECAEMTENLGRGMGVNYDTGVIDEIYFEGYGHPSITRGLCSKIAKDNRARPLTVTSKMVGKAAEEYSFIEASLLKEIVDRFNQRPTERALLELIYENKGTVNESELGTFMKGNDWDAMRRLLAFHLLVKNGGQYKIGMNLLSRSLQREGF